MIWQGNQVGGCLPKGSPCDYGLIHMEPQHYFVVLNMQTFCSFCWPCLTEAGISCPRIEFEQSFDYIQHTDHLFLFLANCKRPLDKLQWNLHFCSKFSNSLVLYCSSSWSKTLAFVLARLQCNVSQEALELCFSYMVHKLVSPSRNQTRLVSVLSLRSEGTHR